jgi:hypothetical protein
MSAVESSEEVRVVLAKPPGRPPAPWIAATGRRLHQQLCAVHGWAVRLDVVESVSLYHIAAAVLRQLLVLAKGLAKDFVERAIKTP